jgi:hypothetical protein
MGKKCIPGLFCVENMTLFIVFVILVVLVYVYYVFVVKAAPRKEGALDGSVGFNQPTVIVIAESGSGSGSYANTGSWQGPFPPVEPPATISQIDSIQSPNIPFGRSSNTVFMQGSTVSPIPNSLTGAIPTQGFPSSYSQIGILTPVVGGQSQQTMILPLMGRRSSSSRSKYQYYTFSNGNWNVRLPVSVNGKSCTAEYGCDEIMNGDTVYVSGYNDVFRATIYEQEFFSYNPFA